MQKFLQRLLKDWVSNLSDKYSSRPDRRRVHSALSKLYKNLLTNPGKRGPIIPFDIHVDKIIILSDQHKGARDSADDFALAESNYLAALDYYDGNGFFYINLGDSEELWKNRLETVKKHNQNTFDKEKFFLNRNAFIKIFGNHDLYWDNDPLSALNLEGIYGQKVKIYEGAILQTIIQEKELNIFLTHGHQGDLQSDGNWFSKWFVSNIWAPLQAYLHLNPNTPAFDERLKTLHNKFMYEWSVKRQNTLLITGHTHQPVFLSLTHLERLYRELNSAKGDDEEEKVKILEEQIRIRFRKGDLTPDFTAYRPTYFNTGCCCFNDGDITGIEIEGGFIRLIKWEYSIYGIPERLILEEIDLKSLFDQINNKET